MPIPKTKISAENAAFYSYQMVESILKAARKKKSNKTVKLWIIKKLWTTNHQLLIVKIIWWPNLGEQKSRETRNHLERDVSRTCTANTQNKFDNYAIVLCSDDL